MQETLRRTLQDSNFSNAGCGKVVYLIKDFIGLNRRFCKLAVLFFSLFACSRAFAQEKFTVNFYGIAAPKSIENMIQITQDLFTAQLRIIPAVTFKDCTSDSFKKNIIDKTDFASDSFSISSLLEKVPEEKSMSVTLFANIAKVEEDVWVCTIYTRNNLTGSIYTTFKDYDSYYKILTDAKLLIQESIEKSTGLTIATPGTIASEETASAKANTNLSLEGISGTWSGEKNISKIVLMKSGRGFIIFTNGSSMNIEIKVENNGGTKILNVKQIGKFNASFYPDIPRQLVLEKAESASPIEWSLTLENNTKLSGQKKSLSLNGTSVEETTTNVNWKKLN